MKPNQLFWRSSWNFWSVQKNRSIYIICICFALHYKIYNMIYILHVSTSSCGCHDNPDESPGFIRDLLRIVAILQHKAVHIGPETIHDRAEGLLLQHQRVPEHQHFLGRFVPTIPRCHQTWRVAKKSASCTGESRVKLFKKQVSNMWWSKYQLPRYSNVKFVVQPIFRQTQTS